MRPAIFTKALLLLFCLYPSLTTKAQVEKSSTQDRFKERQENFEKFAQGNHFKNLDIPLDLSELPKGQHQTFKEMVEYLRGHVTDNLPSNTPPKELLSERETPPLPKAPINFESWKKNLSYKSKRSLWLASFDPRNTEMRVLSQTLLDMASPSVDDLTSSMRIVLAKSKSGSKWDSVIAGHTYTDNDLKEAIAHLVTAGKAFPGALRSAFLGLDPKEQKEFLKDTNTTAVESRSEPLDLLATATSSFATLRESLSYWDVRKVGIEEDVMGNPITSDTLDELARTVSSGINGGGYTTSPNGGFGGGYASSPYGNTNYTSYPAAGGWGGNLTGLTPPLSSPVYRQAADAIFQPDINTSLEPSVVRSLSKTSYEYELGFPNPERRNLIVSRDNGGISIFCGGPLTIYNLTDPWSGQENLFRSNGFPFNALVLMPDSANVDRPITIRCQDNIYELSFEQKDGGSNLSAELYSRVTSPALSMEELGLCSGGELDMLVPFVLVDSISANEETAISALLQYMGFNVQLPEAIEDLKAFFEDKFIESDLVFPVGHSIGGRELPMGINGARSIRATKTIRNAKGSPVKVNMTFICPPLAGGNQSCTIQSIHADHVASLFKKRAEIKDTPQGIVTISCYSGETVNEWLCSYESAAKDIAAERSSSDEATTESTLEHLPPVPLIIGANRGFDSSPSAFQENFSYPLNVINTIVKEGGDAEEIIENLTEVGYQPSSNKNYVRKRDGFSFNDYEIRVEDRKNPELHWVY